MTSENLLNILLNSALLIESICVPILTFLIHRYLDARSLMDKIVNLYRTMVWAMVLIIVLSAVEAFSITLYLLGLLQIDKTSLIYAMGGISLFLIVIMPASLTYYWLKQRREGM